MMNDEVEMNGTEIDMSNAMDDGLSALDSEALATTQLEMHNDVGIENVEMQNDIQFHGTEDNVMDSQSVEGDDVAGSLPADEVYLGSSAAQEEFVNVNSFGDGNVIGCPDIQATAWEPQKWPDNCAPTAEGAIIKQFGYDLDQYDFAYLSLKNGWYRPGEGTSTVDIGKMMDAFGIENHTVNNAGVADLINELAQGHGVIVTVNAEQLWNSGFLNDVMQFACKKLGLDNPTWMPADHALCVTGFDFSDPSHPQVVLNDSGTNYGQGISYPLDKFVDAWENGNFYYTATNDPLPTLSATQLEELQEYDWGQFESGFTMPAAYDSSFSQFADDDFMRMI